jgi:hypothetical protein
LEILAAVAVEWDQATTGGRDGQFFFLFRAGELQRDESGLSR